MRAVPSSNRLILGGGSGDIPVPPGKAKAAGWRSATLRSQRDRLSTNWTQFMGADLGGARVSNWNTQLLSQLNPQYDLIVYDVGPSLGALGTVAVCVGI